MAPMIPNTGWMFHNKTETRVTIIAAKHIELFKILLQLLLQRLHVFPCQDDVVKIRLAVLPPRL